MGEKPEAREDRPEEVWAAELLERYLQLEMPGARVARCTPDPPDFVVHTPTGIQGIGIEVTRTQSFEVTDQGLGNRTSTDMGLLDLIKELNVDVGPKFSGDAGLMVILKRRIPKDEFATFRRWLIKQVTAYAEGRLQGVLIHDPYGELRPLAVPADGVGSRVSGVVANDAGVRNILEHARLSLETALRVKQQRLDRVRWEGGRWLALINTYFLADAEDYTEALRLIQPGYGFARIYLLSPRDETIIRLR